MAIFYSPIGTREQRQSHQIWPQGWIDAAPYAVIYRVDTPFEAYHTGADLNLNTPTWDRDAHSPVYSMGPGVVTYAKFFSSGWGNLIIVRHESHRKFNAASGNW
jgi:murein DD-endopeptidase MepM/ murein hydrolase activator NlpD